jgi:hypothetical protein
VDVGTSGVFGGSDSRERHLLGKRRELLGLLGQGRKLLLCKLGRKFDELRRRLYARHPLGKVEGGFGVGMSIRSTCCCNPAPL